MKANRHGTILLAVMLIVVLGVMSASTVVLTARAGRGAVSHGLGRTQSRAVAWSGVQAVMAELLAQREQLLRGEEPSLSGQWVIFEDGSRSGVARLVPFASETDGAASEAALVNINTATADMLARLDGMDGETAEAIVRSRPSGGYASTGELGAAAGVSISLLVSGESEESNAGDVEAAGVVPWLGCFSADANVQAGLGENGALHAGRARINLNQSWSDDLRRALVDRFDAETADGVKRLMESGVRFQSEADVVRLLAFFQVPLDRWVTILDAFCASPNSYQPGRVDINRAPVEVLKTLPGMDDVTAANIVARRETLDDARKASIVWLLETGVMDVERFAGIVDHVCTRTLQWRVRVEGGILNTVEDEFGAGVAEPESGGLLRDRIVLEAVIDLAAPRPRVAYLRDVSLLEAAAALAEAEAVERDEPPEEAPDSEPSGEAVIGDDVGGSSGEAPLVDDESAMENAAEPLNEDNDEPAEEASHPADAGDTRVGRWRVIK